MTPFENPEPQSDDQPEEFLIDEDLLEVQSQLEQDSQHLASLYPPMNSSRLDELVNRCLVTAEANKQQALVNSGASGSMKKPANSGAAFSRTTRWYQFGTAICIAVLLVGSFTYVWNQPGLEIIDEPVVSNQTEPDFTLVPAVSVSTLPPEFMTATQPELEALYDELPSESMSIEF